MAAHGNFKTRRVIDFYSTKTPTRPGTIMIRTLFTIAILLAMVSQSFGNNNYFIPGDAFFYFEIEQSEWEDFRSGKLLTIQYDRPDILPFMLCGYAGYRNLDIADLPAGYRGRLVGAVAKMKKTYPSKIVIKDNGPPKFLFGGPPEKEKIEINKIRIFVYNKSFDFSKYRIALKYNESWPDSAKAFGHSKKHFHFDFFVETPKGLVESWRMGSNVSPLDVKLPTREKGASELLIKYNPDKLQFLVAPPVSLETLCFPPRESKLTCIVVSSEGEREMIVDKSRKTLWKPAN